MYCYHCGKQIRDDAVFCPFCGARQTEAPRTPVTQQPYGAANQPYVAPQQPYEAAGQSYYSENGMPQPASKKKRTGLIIGLAAAVVAVTVLIVILLQDCGGSEARNTEPAGEGTPQSAWSAQNTTEAPTETLEEPTEEPTQTAADDIEWYDFEEVTTNRSDGYVIRHTLHLSQWISYTNDYETLSAAWAQVGKDNALPSQETMGCHYSNMFDNAVYKTFINYDEVFYAVGYLEAFNETEGYDITKENTVTTHFNLGIGTTAASLMVYYTSESQLFGVDWPDRAFERSDYGPSAKLVSNHWGKVPIVLCYVIDRTPAYPEGRPSPYDLGLWFMNKTDEYRFVLDGAPQRETAAETEETEPEETATETTEPEAQEETTAHGGVMPGTGTAAVEGAELIGTYEGSYTAGQGKTGCTVTVYEEGGALKGTFAFYNLAGRSNSKSGSYTMKIEYDGDGAYRLLEDAWIDQPGGYSMIHCWYVTLDGDTLRGSMNADGSGNAIEVTRK